MDVKTHSAGEAFQYKTRIQKKGKTFNVEVSKLCLLGEMDYLFKLLSLLKKKDINYILVKFSA